MGWRTWINWRFERIRFLLHNFPHINFFPFAFNTIVQLYHTSSSSYTDSVFLLITDKIQKYPFVMQDVLKIPFEKKKSHGNKLVFFLWIGSESEMHLHKSTVFSNPTPLRPSSSGFTKKNNNWFYLLSLFLDTEKDVSWKKREWNYSRWFVICKLIINTMIQKKGRFNVPEL
jgi:hypothetical protein